LLGEVLRLPIAELGIETAKIEDESGTFLLAINVALRALSHMHEGQIELLDGVLGISGTASRAGRELAHRALRDKPSSYGVVASIDLYDDGEPFKLQVAFDGETVSASGKVPYDAGVSESAAELGWDLSEGFYVAEITLVDQDWRGALGPAFRALALLERGYLEIGSGTVRLSGLALTPMEAVQAVKLMRRLPPSFELDTDFELRDDGAMPVFKLSFDALTGASLSGKLPQGLKAEQITGLLGLPEIENLANEGLIGTPDAVVTAIGALSHWLREVDQVSLYYNAGAVSLQAVAAPGIDVGLLRVELSEVFGDAVEVSPPQVAPEQGVERIHAQTGMLERFVGVAWVPVFRFAPTRARCARASSDIVRQDSLTFVADTAELDVRAFRAVARLAGLVVQCVGQSDLTVELIDYTFNQDTEEGNDTLSIARADALAAALRARGVPADKSWARGHGDRHPIVDQSAVIGVGQEDRVEIVWSGGTR
jgi:OOP family OmpA-OmpF porin